MFDRVPIAPYLPECSPVSGYTQPEPLAHSVGRSRAFSLCPNRCQNMVRLHTIYIYIYVIYENMYFTFSHTYFAIFSFSLPNPVRVGFSVYPAFR